MPNSLYSRSSCRRITIVGQVINATTSRGIVDARVKIVAAPAQFIEQVILKAKLFGLSGVQLLQSGFQDKLPDRPGDEFYQSRSGQSFLPEPLPDRLQSFWTALDRSDLKSADKLQLLHHILEDSSLPAQPKFQALQMVLDRLRSFSNGAMIPVERTRTAADGWFFFGDLPSGQYQLEASLPQMGQSYGVAQAQINIAGKTANQAENKFASQAVNETVNPSQQRQIEASADRFEKMFVKFELMPTTLLGKVVSADSQETIAMARVQIAGTDYSVLSSKEVVKQQEQEWNYRFLGLDASNASLTLVFSAQGYTTTRQTVQLQAGETTKLDVQLVLADRAAR